MARRSRRETRAARREQEAAFKLTLGGAALVIGPWLASQTMIGKALLPLHWVGWLMLAIGGGLLWLQRRERRVDTATPPRPAATRAIPRTRSVPTGFPPAHTLDRVATELDRSAAARAEKSSTMPARPTAWSKAVFDVIEWRCFEAVVEALFQQAGFETKSQSHGADGGIDIWLYSRHQPGEAVSLVQCKHWSKRVGVDKIRELRGVMAAHKVARGQFAATSGFTPEAEAFARANGINLIDADGLLALIGKRAPEQRHTLLGVALEGDYWRPTCVKCGTKMVERTSRGGNALWGCSDYPRCKTRPLPRQV